MPTVPGRSCIPPEYPKVPKSGLETEAHHLIPVKESVKSDQKAWEKLCSFFQ